MIHRLICVGYEGHECGKVVYHNWRLVAPRCAECKRMHDNERARRAHQDYRTTVPVSRRKPTAAELKERRRQYQHEYYMAHREKAKEYQKSYNRQHRKTTTPKRSTSPKISRPLTRDHYTPSDLMNLSPEKLVRAMSRIVSEQAELAAVK